LKLEYFIYGKTALLGLFRPSTLQGLVKEK